MKRKQSAAKLLATNFDLITEMHKDIKQIKEDLIPELRTAVGVLNTKNSIWSSVTGLLGGAIAIVTLKIWK